MKAVSALDETERGTTPPTTRSSAPRRLTSALLSIGAAVSAACFVVAAIAQALGRTDVLGGSTRAARMTDMAALAEGIAAVDPWAWASLGTFALIVTPAIALLATAWEYATVSDRRTAMLALVVLVILASSAVVAVLR